MYTHKYCVCVAYPQHTAFVRYPQTPFPVAAHCICTCVTNLTGRSVYCSGQAEPEPEIEVMLPSTGAAPSAATQSKAPAPAGLAPGSRYTIAPPPEVTKRPPCCIYSAAQHISLQGTQHMYLGVEYL